MTLQHYMDYTAESLIPVMAHIAKNVVKVNEGLTKHIVSVKTCIAILWLACTFNFYVTEQWHNIVFLFFSQCNSFSIYLTIFCSCRLLKVNIRLRSRWGSLPSHSSNLQWWKILQSKPPSERTMFLAPCADLYSFNLNFLTWPEGSAR